MTSEYSGSDFSGHYPIREFARLTGVNPVTLRAWERRYGIIQPQRTDKGHRFYSEADIQRIQNILYWLDQGYPIRQVRLLLQNNQIISQQDDGWQTIREQHINFLSRGQLQQLDHLITDGLANYPMAVYYERCLQPVMAFLQSEPLLYQLYCQQLKRKLICLVHQQQKHNSGPVLLLVSNHDQNEIVMYAMAYALGAAAFRVEVYCQTITPAELSQLVTLLNCSQLWADLCASVSGKTEQWQQQLNELQQSLPVFSNLAGGDISATSDSNTNSNDKNGTSTARGIWQLPESFAEQLAFFIQHQNITSQPEVRL